MRRQNRTYSFFQLLSAVGMILALLWLTVSAPFVQEAQQKLAKQEQTSSCNSCPLSSSEEESNPFGNSTEEKTPSSTSFSEEYLHDSHGAAHFFLITSPDHLTQDDGTYIAFHGELLVPPPNVG